MNENNQNKIITTIKTFFQNKYNVYIIIAIGILLLIIASMISLISREQKNTLPIPSPTPITTSAPSPTLSFPDQELKTIEKDTKPELDQRIETTYTVSKTKTYGDEWALLEVSNPDTDQAHVVVKKENGLWKVVFGPGTFFEEQQLQIIGAPQELIDEANNAF